MMKLPKYSFLNNIPTPILWDILCKLPIKTCLNCKLVCKDWYNIITSPEFSSFRSSNGSHHTLLCTNGICIDYKTFHLVDIDKTAASCVDEEGNLNVGVDATIKFKLDCIDRPGYIIRGLPMKAHCNGVICLKFNDDKYYVLNLLTAQFVIVKQYKNLEHCWDNDAFGYCPSTNQYKILVLDNSRSKPRAMIITVGENNWRYVGESPMVKWKEEWCYLNGSSHQRARWYIWAFHFGDEKFSRIPLSKEMKGYQGAQLITLGSCLGFCCRRPGDFRTEIWVMKEYGVQDSWVKQYVIERNGFSSHQLILPLDFGKIMLKFDKFVIYDPETGVEKEVEPPGRCVLDMPLMGSLTYNALFCKF